MTAEILARSLGRLPDSMVEEALHARRARRSHPALWLRAAACIAVAASLLFGISFINNDGEKFITAPSLLAVTAYSFEDGMPIAHELAEGVAYHETFLGAWCAGINCVEGLPITFSFLGENMTLSASVNHGAFIDGKKDLGKDLGSKPLFISREDNGYLGQSFSLSKSRTVYWKPYERDPDTGKSKNHVYGLDIPIYLDIIIREGDYITGYAVMQIKMNHPENPSYVVNLLASKQYPKIFGIYQPVTEEYVREQIEKEKK